ncbi:MAG: hypothetical protein JRF65_13790 [Deltaproteobacteria bacterium]|nr:hypothetical protein [Deltaproteobacteria bacterium]
MEQHLHHDEMTRTAGPGFRIYFSRKISACTMPADHEPGIFIKIPSLCHEHSPPQALH